MTADRLNKIINAARVTKQDVMDLAGENYYTIHSYMKGRRTLNVDRVRKLALGIRAAAKRLLHLADELEKPDADA